MRKFGNRTDFIRQIDNIRLCVFGHMGKNRPHMLDDDVALQIGQGSIERLIKAGGIFAGLEPVIDQMAAHIIGAVVLVI